MAELLCTLELSCEVATHVSKVLVSSDGGIVEIMGLLMIRGQLIVIQLQEASAENI